MQHRLSFPPSDADGGQGRCSRLDRGRAPRNGRHAAVGGALEESAASPGRAPTRLVQGDVPVADLVIAVGAEAAWRCCCVGRSALRSSAGRLVRLAQGEAGSWSPSTPQWCSGSRPDRARPRLPPPRGRPATRRADAPAVPPDRPALLARQRASAGSGRPISQRPSSSPGRKPGDEEQQDADRMIEHPGAPKAGGDRRHHAEQDCRKCREGRDEDEISSHLRHVVVRARSTYGQETIRRTIQASGAQL